MTTAPPHVDRVDRVDRVDTTTDDALGASDVTDLLDRLARGEVSGGELRAAAVERCRRADRTLNAVVREIAETPAEVSASGALAAVPCALKDNEALRGYPTSSGSRAVADVPAEASTPVVRLLLGLGLDPVATTTLPEFGLTASTESLRFGATGNPWDPSRSAGGSSGGSAALVAAGAVPIAHANDGGGSIRIPAAACGIVGLKPSRGRLPNEPSVDRLPVRIVTQGVLTRTVRDTALCYAAAEATAPAPGLPPVGQVRGPGRQRLRVGVCLTPSNGLRWAPDVVATVRTTADELDRLGHLVEETGPPVDDRFGPDFLTLWALLAFLLHRAGRYSVGAGFDPTQVEPLMRGLSGRLTLQVDRLPGALHRLRRLAREGEACWRSYDVLVSPVTAHPAPPLGYLGPDVPVRTHLVRLIRFCSITSVQNVSGSPAISLPLGRSAAGLPIGVQLAAPLGHERRLLEVAYELERSIGWPGTPGASWGPLT